MSEIKNIDAKVLELFSKVKEKQKKIAKNERPSWKTNCSFGKNQDSVSDRINLQVITDLDRLIDAHVFLKQKLDYWLKSCETLGVKSPLKWLGYSFQDWEDDIKYRVSQLQLNKEKKELEVLEARLNSLITVDQRREMELAEIEKELN